MSSLVPALFALTTLVAPPHAQPRAQSGTCDPSLSLPSRPVSRVINGFSVVIDGGTGAFSVTPPGAATPALRGPGTCVEGASGPQPGVRLGVGEPFSARGFGAWLIGMGDRSDINWTPVSGAPPTTSSSSTSLVLTWELADAALGQVALRFDAVGTRDLRVSLTLPAAVDAAELSMVCAEGEAFFGLGSQVAGMDLRGRTYPLWTQEGGIGKFDHTGLWPLTNSIEAAYAPMGVVHSSAGWSGILTHDSYSELDLCEADPTRSALRSFGPQGIVLVGGASPRARMSALTDYTGRMTEPPTWLFAPWNDAVGGPERLREVASILRESAVPSSVIWSEDWIGEDQTPFGFGLTYAWEWDPAAYPDLPGDVDWLHSQGFAFMGYFNPFVVSTTRMWDEGVAGGYLIHDAAGEVYVFADPFFRPASLVDLTNDAAREWLLSYQLTAAVDVGLDGWMVDFAEWLPEDAVLASGEPGWEVHNRYPLMWQQANREALELAHQSSAEAQNNWTYFARSGWASVESGGTGGIAPSMWGGDQNTNWRYGDGFPSVVPIATHLGLSGVAVFGSDIAGYTTVMSPPTTKELYLRWSALGAFHPLMRTHHGLGECENWAFDRDTETLAHHRRYATIHTLLFPTLWALAEQAQEQGLPMQRHPFLVEPQASGLWEGDQYQMFLGDDLLIAPVLAEGATRRQVRLPAQGWWPLLGEEPLRGEEPDLGDTWQLRVEAPVTEIPVFVRPGRALVLLGESVDSFYGAEVSDVSTLEDVAGSFDLALYPDASGAVISTPVGAGTVTATALPRREVDWSLARVGGAPVQACSSTAEVPPCYEDFGRSLKVAGTSITVTVEGGTVLLTSPTSQRYELGVAGQAWGEWAAPTTVTDLDPNIPPPCE